MYSSELYAHVGRVATVISRHLENGNNFCPAGTSNSFSIYVFQSLGCAEHQEQYLLFIPEIDECVLYSFQLTHI